MLYFINPDMAPAHLIQWRQGIGSFVVEGTASSPDRESCCCHSTFFFIVCKRPHSDGKPALLAHPPLPVAQGTWLAEPGMQPLRGSVKDKSEDKEQPHPSPSSLACTSSTEKRRSSSCSLTPQTRATHIRTASLWHWLHTSSVSQQRGQEAATQTQQWAGAGSPAALPGAGQPARECGWHGHAWLLIRSQVHTHSPGVLAVSFYTKAICPCPHLQLS